MGTPFLAIMKKNAQYDNKHISFILYSPYYWS